MISKKRYLSHLNQVAFKGILEEIRGFWNATGFGPITKTVEGDLVGIITFPGHTIDLEGNSRMKISKAIFEILRSMILKSFSSSFLETAKISLVFIASHINQLDLKHFLS